MHTFRDDGGWQELAGYSRATRAGRRIAVSGTTASAPDGSALHPGDTHAQTVTALRRSAEAVEALGGSLADVVRSRVYLVQAADWREAARAHRDVLGDVAPANTMLYVAGLIGDGLLVEVELEAEVGDAGHPAVGAAGEAGW